MNARRAPLCSADMQASLVELDLMPLEATDFTCSQPMTIGDQDHGGIAMTMAIHLAGRVHQSLDLALGEVAACNCEVFSVWRAGIGYLFSHEKSLSCKYDWKDNSLFLHSQQSFISKTSKKSFAIFSRKIFGFLKLGPAQGLGRRRGEGADGSRSLCASSTHARNPAMGPES